MEPSDFKAECLWLPVSPSAASTGLEDDTVEEVAKEAPKEASQPLPAPGATLLRAKALTKLAMDDAKKAQSSTATQTSHVQRLREECQAFKGRIRRSVSSVSKAFEVTRSLEGYLVHYEDAKSRVRHAKSARQQDLAVCQRRLEIVQGLEMEGKKSRRALLEALQFEQEALNLQQRELELLLQDIETSVELCRDLRNQLQKEASQRRSALRGKAVEFKVFDDENFFAKKARGSEEEAQRLLQRAVSSIQWTDLECSKAFQRVQECLQKCSEEEQQLRRQYDLQLRDVDFAITCADWTVSRKAKEGLRKGEVLLHELVNCQKQLKTLVRSCKTDLQTLEKCRLTSLSSLNYGPKCPKKLARSASSLKELRRLRSEERRLRRQLRGCAEGVERCAAWAQVLFDLEGHGAQP